MRSPGRAPDRNPAFPFGAVPTTTMSARIPSGDSAVSPPARVTLYLSPRRIKLRAKRPTQLCGNPRGSASERNAATGSPPMAAMSLSPRARHRCPTDSAECQSRRKWIPSRVKSVVTSVSFSFCRPRPRSRSTAQSSPIPNTTSVLVAAVARRRIWAIRAFSAITTTTTISEAQRRMQPIVPGIQGSPPSRPRSNLSRGYIPLPVLRNSLRALSHR